MKKPTHTPATWKPEMSLHELVHQTILHYLAKDLNALEHNAKMYYLVENTHQAHLDESERYNWVLEITPWAKSILLKYEGNTPWDKSKFYTPLQDELNIWAHHHFYDTVAIDSQDNRYAIYTHKLGNIFTITHSDDRVYISLTYSGRY